MVSIQQIYTTTLHYTHYTALNYTALQLQLQRQLELQLGLQVQYATLQLQLQLDYDCRDATLRYTTLH